MKQTYDGYHFCWPSPDIYNPYTLPIVKIGVNINPDTRTINDWVIER